MDLENIKTMLGEAYTEDVENAIKTLVDSATNGGADYVPKSKYDKIKEQFDELSKQANNIQGAESEKADLQKKVDDLQNAYAQLEKESEAKLNALKNEHLFEKELATFKPRNLKALSALIDKEKLVFKDDVVEGLKEQIEGLQKSDSFLFEEIPTGTGVPSDATALKQATSPAEDSQLRKCFGLEEIKNKGE